MFNKTDYETHGIYIAWSEFDDKTDYVLSYKEFQDYCVKINNTKNNIPWCKIKCCVNLPKKIVKLDGYPATSIDYDDDDYYLVKIKTGKINLT